MTTIRANCIDLSAGGNAWRGWRLGPYGRARDWRLFAPDGQVYTAGDVAALAALALDVTYLQGRVRELEQEQAGLSADQLRILTEAAAILQHVTRTRRRTRPAALRLV